MFDTILLTGGAGFIGSNLVRYLLRTYPRMRIVNVDLLTYAGSLANLAGVLEHDRHTFVRADIANKDEMQAVFAAYHPDAVVHLAAQSHVDRSIAQPEEFVRTNVLGTQLLLDCARTQWRTHPNDGCFTYREGSRFLYVSTDEVYGTLGAQGLFTEQSPLLPRNPYSASKAGAELLVHAAHTTYGLPVLITRCVNNYGPYQHAEKLIPRMVYAALAGEPLPVYGDGLQVREWVHVLDHCAALARVLEFGAVGEVYNIGGGRQNESTNLAVVHLIVAALGISDAQITHVADRPGHDRRYALDCTKISTALGWQPTVAFADGLRETVRWYKAHSETLFRI